MYWKDEGEDEEELKQHIVDEMDEASETPNRVVSSSKSVPSSNKAGDDPPHVKAKEQYETITDSFLCTMDQDEPIAAELKDDEVTFVGVVAAAKSASQAADEARGPHRPPSSISRLRPELNGPCLPTCRGTTTGDRSRIRWHGCGPERRKVVERIPIPDKHWV